MFNYQTDVIMKMSTLIRTLITTPNKITATNSGKVLLTKTSQYVHKITGTGSNFSVELPAPSTLTEGWRAQIMNRTGYPVKLLKSSDLTLETIPAGDTIEVVLTDAVSEDWEIIGTRRTSYQQSTSITTTTNGTLTLTSLSPTVRFFTGTATGYSVILPNATTLLEAHKFTFINTSTQPITIKNAGGDALTTVAPSSSMDMILQNATTSNGIWFNSSIGNFSLGNQYQYYEKTTSVSTTSTTFATAASFTTNTPLISGAGYHLGVFFNWTTAETSYDVIFRLMVNGVQVGPLYQMESKEAQSQVYWESGFFHIAGNGSVATIALEFRSEQSGKSFTALQERFEIWRVD